MTAEGVRRPRLTYVARPDPDRPGRWLVWNRRRNTWAAKVATEERAYSWAGFLNQNEDEAGEGT